MSAHSTEPWHSVLECAESQTLDFKFCLPGKDEPSKVEFAKDVSAALSELQSQTWMSE